MWENAYSYWLLFSQYNTVYESSINYIAFCIHPQSL